MRFTRREQIIRWLLVASVLASGLVASLLASPVFAGTCPIGGVCG
jgi:hypothetical protein